METLDLVFSFAEEEDFQQVVKICSPRDYGGMDYMSAFYSRWMQEPRRITFLGKIKERVVALASALLVDGGQTAIFQGRRVVPDLRGRGIAGAIERHMRAYIQLHHPEVGVVRLSQAGPLSAETLCKYRLITREAILSLCCEAADLGLFLSELRSRLSSSSDVPVTLSQQQAEALVLTPHVVSKLLTDKILVINWEPLKPQEDNLEVLRRRKLTWIVDRESEPSALSLGTPPYAVPYRHDALRININIFGHSLSSVCSVFLAQLEMLPDLQGFLIIYAFVDPQIWSGLHQFCENIAKVSFFTDYFEEIILEDDL